MAGSTCGFDVANSLAYLVREVVQVKQAMLACPQPKACAVGIMKLGSWSPRCDTEEWSILDLKALIKACWPVQLAFITPFSLLLCSKS